MKMEKLFYWAPRVLAILYTIFISMFALDVFGEDFSWLALFMHLVPTYILIGATLIAWRWEVIGGVIFAALGIWYIGLAWGKFDWITGLIVAGPVFLIAILFGMQNRLGFARKPKR